MFICSMITFVFCQNFQYFPYKTLHDFLPSITFIQPEIFNLTGSNISFIDGSYWSLLVEVKFYIFISLLYFNKKLNKHIESIFAILIILNFIFNLFELRFIYIIKVFQFISLANYLHWFLLGISTFRYFYDDSQNSFFFLIFSIIITSAHTILFENNIFGVNPLVLFFIINLLIFSFIYLATFSTSSINKFSFLSYFGKNASYNFYLLHQNIGVILIIFSSFIFEDLLPFIPIFIIILILFISLLIKYLFEDPLSFFLKKLVNAK